MSASSSEAEKSRRLPPVIPPLSSLFSCSGEMRKDGCAPSSFPRVNQAAWRPSALAFHDLENPGALFSG